MKKLKLVLFLTLATLTTSFAQGSLAKGAKQVNAGLGFSNYGLPVYLGVDFGVHESITVGPRVSYRRFSQDFLNDNFTQSLIILSFNGNYHFNKLIELPKEWDLYAGLTLGYYIWSSSDIGGVDVGESSGIGFEGQIGARYFFSNKFGVNLEFGGGTGTGGTFGITIKI